MFQINFTSDALSDIKWFSKRERKIIFSDIDVQLEHQPNIETRNRKRLRPKNVAEWELRIGKYRVFYDVNKDDEIVEVKMVGYKKGNNLFVHGQEYKL
jgi:mRNA-degrading endonuclease RelE of RelBE toxin-antitoxin system